VLYTPLYLATGVREVYLDWLRGYRPDLVERYSTVFARGSESSRRYHDWLAAQLLPLIAAHGLPPPDATIEDKFALHGRIGDEPPDPQPTLF